CSDAIGCDGAPIGRRIEKCELPILGRWGGGWRREAEAGEVRHRRRDRRGAGARRGHGPILGAAEEPADAGGFDLLQPSLLLRAEAGIGLVRQWLATIL